MASRLIQQEAEAQTVAPGYVPPVTLVVAPPVAAPIPVETVDAEIPTVLLARHVIEPELLSATPRLVERSVAAGMSPLLPMVCLIFPTIQFYSLIRRHPEKAGEILLIPALMLGAAGLVIWIVYYFTNRRREILRTGLPRRAFVETVGKASFVDGSRKITYRYEAAPGEFVSGTVKDSLGAVEKHRVAPGYVFTLLVPRDGVGEPLPYFMATTHRVIPVPATVVSQNVSVRVAEAEAKRLALTAKQTGTLGAIEPELLTATPRQVRTKSKPFYKAQAEHLLITALLTLVLYYFTNVRHLRLGDILMVVGTAAGTIASQFFVLYQRRGTFDSPLSPASLSPAQLLAVGTPTRAVVTHVDSKNEPGTPLRKQTVAFTYQYEKENGRPETGWLVLPQTRAWQLGLEKGAFFTVLYNPKEPTAHTPYFQIADAEIVGAMGAKIAPP